MIVWHLMKRAHVEMQYVCKIKNYITHTYIKIENTISKKRMLNKG